MDKTEKLTETSVNAAIEAYKLYTGFVNTISDRMTYILNHCVAKVGGKVKWWDWANEDCDSDGSGDFMLSYDSSDDTLEIRGEWSQNQKMVFIDKNGNEWELTWGGFPMRWLYEDFEEEYEKGLALYLEKTKNKREQAKAGKLRKAEEKKALVTSAASKLTKEEKKALGLK